MGIQKMLIYFRFFTTKTLSVPSHPFKNVLKSLDSKVFNITNKKFNIGKFGSVPNKNPTLT